MLAPYTVSVKKTVIFIQIMSDFEIIEILELAAKGELLEKVDSDSVLDIQLVKELYEGGLLSGNDGSDLVRTSYSDLKITTEGREHLKTLKKEHHASTPKGIAMKIGERFLGRIEGIIFALLIAWLVSKFIK